MLATHNLKVLAPTNSYVYSLKPLWSEEFDTFVVVPNTPLKDVALRELQLESGNAHNEKTICAADNLFACGNSLAETHPEMLAKGKLARAVFDIRVEGSDRPHRFCICPPDHLSLEVLADFPSLLPWLEKCRLMVLRNAVQVLGLMLVAAAVALAPCPDTDDVADFDYEPGRYARTT